jgi:NADH-quinone oxidoreductase subunit M
MQPEWYLPTILLLPFLGGISIWAFHRSPKLSRWWALGHFAVGLLLSLGMWRHIATSKEPTDLSHVMSLQQSWFWMPDLGVQFALGADGVSAIFVVTSSIMALLALLTQWEESKHPVAQSSCLLLLQAGIVGSLLATDLFLLALSWELALVMMVSLVALWGGQRSLQAATKMGLQQVTGSLILLLVFLYLGLALQGGSFSILALYEAHIPTATQRWLCIAMLLGVALKTPLFPFHIWFPDAHHTASSAGRLLLTGIFVQLGLYAFIRIGIPLFPKAYLAFAQPLTVLAIVGLLYGTLLALVQPDITKLLAYLMCSQFGLICLGLFSFQQQGLQGSILHIINVTISMGGLCVLLHFLLERRPTTTLIDFGGLARPAPILAAFFGVFGLSIIGVPGLNGFVSEFLVVWGAFTQNALYGAVALVGLMLSAVSMLWLMRRMFLGPLQGADNRNMSDLTAREKGVSIALVLLVVGLGWAPGMILRTIKPTIRATMEHVQLKHQTTAQNTHSPRRNGR